MELQRSILHFEPGPDSAQLFRLNFKNQYPPPPRIREFDVRIPYIFSCQDFVRMSLLPFPLSKTCKIRSEARCIGFEWGKGSRLIRAKSSYEKNVFAKFLIGRGAYVKLLLKCSFSLFHYNISITPNKGGGQIPSFKIRFSICIFFRIY